MQIAVVTGASAGIGREFVFSIDRRYELDEIWVIARRTERLEELSGRCRNRIRPVVMDLTDPGDLEEYRHMLENEKPEIKLLVNSAGCGVFGPFEEKELDKLLGSVQLNSVARDSIINVGSNSSWQPVPYQAVYGASKSYVLSFSRAIGRELRPRGIHVMCVCPGWIRTEFQEYAHHDEYIRYVDRWYDPDEVAEQAMKDLEKKKEVSILGAPVRRQVKLVKHLPVDLVMDIWCRQQGFDMTDNR